MEQSLELHRKYEDLNLNQRIMLKGFIENNENMKPYKAVWLLWGFKKAVDFFLTNDLNILL